MDEAIASLRRAVNLKPDEKEKPKETAFLRRRYQAEPTPKRSVSTTPSSRAPTQSVTHPRPQGDPRI